MAKERQALQGRDLPLPILTGIILTLCIPIVSPAPGLAAVCGDAVLDYNEVCDDGNLADGDGCNSFCQLEAASCIDDVTHRLNNCTANDVRVARMLNVQDTTCEAGTTIDLQLIAELVANSAERWDIGMFVALDGGTARTGSCYQDFLDGVVPPLQPDGPDCSGICSTSGDACLKDEDCPVVGETCEGGYEPGALLQNLDGSLALFSPGGPFFDGECSEDPGDVCGDIEQGVLTVYQVQQTLTVPCRDSDGDGAVDVGSCLSWDNGRSDGSSNKPSCLTVRDTVPNTKAKCKCETINIGNVFVGGKIIVDKVTEPAGDAQSFNFSIVGGPDDVTQAFSLTDQQEPHDSGSLKPSFLDPGNGTYSVKEASVPEGWDSDGGTCVSDSATPGDTADDFTLTDHSSIDLGSGETVRCTFTNTKRGTIIVEKQTLPDGDPATFDFTGDADGSIGDGQQITVSNLQPGTYSSTEAVPEKWELTGIVCDDGGSDTPSGGSATPIAAGGSGTATFNLDPGETVTCTFTNTRVTAFLEVVKALTPSEDPGLFDCFIEGVATAAGVGDGGTTERQELLPGTYTVGERGHASGDNVTDLDSYVKSIECRDQGGLGGLVTVVPVADPDAFAFSLGLESDDDIVCVISNVRQGSITVDKVTDPSGDSQPFDFQVSWLGDGTEAYDFQLADATTPHDSGDLAPGTYSVFETVPDGWDSNGTTCTSSLGGTEDPSAIDLQAGETVACVFNNTKLGTIIINKDAVPDDDQEFNFTFNSGGAETDFSLSDPPGVSADSSATFDNLMPTGFGAQSLYTVAEESVAGWTLAGIQCEDVAGNPQGSVDLAAGEVAISLAPGQIISCTFTNVPPIALTDSSLCTFDVDGDLSNGRQFRRIFTQDVQNWPQNMLTATNPGQFYWNVSVQGTPGEVSTIALQDSWPFVSQGARPIHVYPSVWLCTDDQSTNAPGCPDNIQPGLFCYLPGGACSDDPSIGCSADADCADAGAGFCSFDSVAVQHDIVLNQIECDDPDKACTPHHGSGQESDTGYDANGVPETTDVVFDIVIPATGFAYVNQHLDDGVKGRYVDVDVDGVPERYMNALEDNDALDTEDTTRVLIPDLANHVFCVAQDGGLTACDDPVQNVNEFKRFRGFGGLVTLDAKEGDPIGDVPIVITDPDGVVISVPPQEGVVMLPDPDGRLTTDADGYYTLAWQHKGKQSNYTIELGELDGYTALQYSLDGETFESCPLGDDACQVSVPVGGKMKFAEVYFILEEEADSP